MANLRRVTALLLAVLCTSALASCGGDDDNANAGRSPATSPTIPFKTARVSTQSAQRGLLTSVVASKEATYTRVIFQFREALPGYVIEYGRRPIVQDGSGDEVNVEGDEVLMVRFEPSSGFDTEAPGGGKPTYNGPKRITVGGNSDPVREVVQVSDFEAVLEWAVGLTGKRPFRTATAVNPPSLVIDVEALDS